MDEIIQAGQVIAAVLGQAALDTNSEV